MESEERLAEQRLQARQRAWVKNHICKKCLKKLRQNGSSRCQECAFAFQQHRADENRLKRKVEAQANIKNK